MDRIFVYIDPANIKQNIFTCNPSESHHVHRVLRCKVGDELHLLDGRGIMYRGQIKTLSPLVSGSIQEIMPEYGENTRAVHLVQAVLKRPALERAVEQATELGARSLTLLLTERVVKKEVNLSRLQKIILATSKQCGRSRFLKIKGPVQFHSWIRTLESSGTFVCHWNGEGKISREVTRVPDKDITCIIGPEGDFSPSELLQILSKGVPVVSLGNRRLRAETAVSSALAVINEHL